MGVGLLASVDALAAVYLITYAIRRERRERARVVIVSGMLAVWALALVVIGWPRPPAPSPVRAPAPSAPSIPGTAASGEAATRRGVLRGRL